ncbi:MAG: M55 family metallopeptidase [Armatimonadetes bacterium]|nr:M55 family metallopeptidase [Armatimonadota bacterium]
MKVYIITDMEGITGIWRQEMVDPSRPEHYNIGRRLLMGDINAAIRGAFDAGATEVVVNDGHGGAPHIILEEMDERAEYVRPNGPGDVMVGLDETFDAMFHIGAHAMAGTRNAFLDHTQSSTSWYNYYLNGKKYGEIGQSAVIAGHYGVPLLLVTGDEAACREAENLLGPGNVVTVAVKKAIGRQWARCLHPKRAQQMIYEGAKKALQLVGKVEPYRIETPIRVRLEFYRTDMADPYENHPRVERVGPREIEVTVPDALHIMNW